MKTRNGFVSNSSSSSFIIAVGKVVDKEKALSFIEACGIKYDWSINKLSSFIEAKNDWSINKLAEICNWHIKDNKLTIYAIGNIKAELDLDSDILNENSEILIIYNFRRINFDELRNDYCDYDLSKFSISEVKLYNGLNEENGFVNVDKKFGAGRD